MNSLTSFWIKNKYWVVPALLVGFLWNCTANNDKLPILGQRGIIEKVVNGKTVTDSVDHTIPNFSFISQYGDSVTAQTLDNKIYVADFFFTSCPTICPKMKVQLKRVYEKFKENSHVMLLSHTIDPAHDSVAVLKEFAQNLGITGKQWLFVTGDRDKIYDIAEKSYMVTAQADSTAPGGNIHSGAFILVDKNKHIRGLYDGTTEAGVDKLMIDMNGFWRREIMSQLARFFVVSAVVTGLLSCQSEAEIKRQKYITEGILVYKNNCANCHQSKGEGLAALYPPIANSDYLVANKNKVICLIRYGQQGAIVVNGKSYNRPMPPQPQLSDLEVAELATYIYNEWGNETRLTGVKKLRQF